MVRVSSGMFILQHPSNSGCKYYQLYPKQLT